MEQNQQFVNYSNRLRIALETKNTKQKDLAKKYDYLSTSLVSKFLNNQKSITDIFARLCSDEDINIHWIATGNGDMFVQNQDSNINVHNHNGNVAVNGTITINTKDYTDGEEIKELLELLKDVPKSWIDKILIKLKKSLKAIDEEF